MRGPEERGDIDMRIITETSWGKQFPHSITIEVNGYRRLYVDAANANARYAEAFEQGRQSAPTQENVEELK